MLNKESSAIHFGPHTPLGGMSVETGQILTAGKSYLFLAAIGLQFILYFCIHLGLIEMPPDESEKSYGYSLTDGAFHSHEQEGNHFPIESSDQSLDQNDEAELESEDIFPSHRYPMGFSLTFIENCYIVLWISKDYFWSWATGDFKISGLAGLFTGHPLTPSFALNSFRSGFDAFRCAECFALWLRHLLLEASFRKYDGFIDILLLALC
jgi:hypothetical protein